MLNPLVKFIKLTLNETLKHELLILSYQKQYCVITFKTRMHSSRMRTAHSLTVFHSIRSAQPPWMQTPWMQTTLMQTPTAGYRSLPPGCRSPGAQPPWMQTPWMQTPRCKPLLDADPLDANHLDADPLPLWIRTPYSPWMQTPFQIPHVTIAHCSQKMM